MASLRTNAHHLAADLRRVIDRLVADGEPVARLDLARAHGRSAVRSLEDGGHLVEVMSGALFVSPLTIRELDALPPWREDDVSRLRSLWHKDVPISAAAEALGRTGGDLLQKAWTLGLDRRQSRPDDDFLSHVPAWRVRRLRLALAEAERRGAAAGDDGTDLGHRALRRRFAKGRRLAAPAKPDAYCRPWTKQDVTLLQQLRDDARTIETIARVLERTPAGVTSKLCELGLRRLERWDIKEDEIVAAGVCDRLSNKEIAARLQGRTVRAVKCRVQVLGLTGSRAFRPWTEKERQALRQVYLTGRSVKLFAEYVGRSRSACRYQAKLMGLVHPASTMVNQYTPEEDARIRAAWAAGERPADVARELGRPIRSLYVRAFKLGVTGKAANYRRPILPEDVERLRAAAGRGLDGAACAAEISRSLKATYRIAYNHGISIGGGS